MRTLLSLDVDPTIPSHVEIETEYNELLHSAKMQQLLSEIVFIIFYSKGAVNQKTQMDNCITLEKIITLLGNII